ncbi:hypothetical protein GCM10010517_10650 [Streptosporangium fragile]|uniref:Hydantoinase A/oxoprolinase domain-containing protein n=1 Tax=Streptosporangium fragile TaxID=46186 RepID=A0ABN3VR88_9ACTN
MILGVDLGAPATVVAALRDGVPEGPIPTRAPGGVRPAAVWGTPVRAVCVAVDLDTVRLAPVAAIRVGGPCPPALGPLTGWPEGAGRAVVVRGGHSLTGRPVAELDSAAVAEFAAGCGLTDFAVTATGSPVLAEHELAVAEIVAAEVPGARITLSYEFGQVGLRERENSAILNAALGPYADDLAARLGRDLPGVPLFFARTGSGLVSAHYFRRYPLVCYLGAFTCALRGGATLAGLSDTAVQERRPATCDRRAAAPGVGRTGGEGAAATAVRTGMVTGGLPRTGARSDLPVRVNLPLPLTVEADTGVAVGPLAGEAGPGWTVPGRAELAVAYGAALAAPVAEVERIVQARGRAELDRALDDARDEALTRVVSAGAAPGSARVAATTVNPLSYLPDGLYRVRVTAEGATP